MLEWKNHRIFRVIALESSTMKDDSFKSNARILKNWYIPHFRAKDDSWDENFVSECFDVLHSHCWYNSLTIWPLFIWKIMTPFFRIIKIFYKQFTNNTSLRRFRGKKSSTTYMKNLSPLYSVNVNLLSLPFFFLYSTTLLKTVVYLLRVYRAHQRWSFFYDENFALFHN